MYTLQQIVLCCLLGIAGLSALAQQAAPPAQPAPAPTLGDGTKIAVLVVEHFWQTNCYILSGPTGKAIVIDPGDDLDYLGPDHYRPNGKDAQRIYDYLTTHKLTLQYMIFSHGHLDHIGASKMLKEKTGAIIAMHEGDIKPAGDPFAGCPKDTRMFEGGLPKVDRPLKEGDIISTDGMSLRVIHTPGHSPGSMCLLTHFHGKTVVFTGDTLLHYYKGIDGNYYDTGRTNFRDGSGDQDLLYRMIREKLFTLPDDTVVFPGHYDASTIGEEKKYSPARIMPAAPAPTPAAGDAPAK